MNEKLDVRVEVEAVKSLVLWKAKFAEEVIDRANQLAANSSNPQIVTVQHYRLAAQIVLEKFSASIMSECDSNVRTKAA